MYAQLTSTIADGTDQEEEPGVSSAGGQPTGSRGAVQEGGGAGAEDHRRPLPGGVLDPGLHPHRTYPRLVSGVWLSLHHAWLWGVQGADKGAAAGYKKEAEEFGKLGMTPVSESLRGIFFGHQKCTKNPFGNPATPADVRRTAATARSLRDATSSSDPSVFFPCLFALHQTVAVLGAGLMGAGIAQVSAQKGYNVVLKDKDLKGLTRGEQQIAGNLVRACEPPPTPSIRMPPWCVFRR